MSLRYLRNTILLSQPLGFFVYLHLFLACLPLLDFDHLTQPSCLRLGGFLALAPLDFFDTSPLPFFGLDLCA